MFHFLLGFASAGISAFLSSSVGAGDAQCPATERRLITPGGVVRRLWQPAFGGMLPAAAVLPGSVASIADHLLLGSGVFQL